MGKPSSNDETTIRHQFDRFCQKVLHDEKVDYIRKQEHLKQHEITFDEVPGKELYKLLVFNILIDSFLCWKIVLWTKFIFLAISASLISIK